MTETSKGQTDHYIVRPLESQDLSMWDAFVDRSPQGTLFHTTTWLRTTGVPFRIYGCFDDHGLAGGMAVEIVGPQAAGHSYSVVARYLEKPAGSTALTMHGCNCPYLGVVLSPPGRKYVTSLAQQRRVTKALATYVKDRFASVFSRMSVAMVDVEPFMSAGYTTSLHYTYTIDLSDLEVAWSNMTDKRRNDIRKAERDGIVVDTDASIRDVVRLLSSSFRRQKREARFSEFAERRDEVLRNQNRCRCFVARDASGEALAGIYMVWDAKCTYYIIGGYTPEAHRGAGALAIWHAIQYAGELGVPQFDLLGGGTGLIERFMRDFGGRLTVSFNVHYERPSFRRDMRRVARRLQRLLSRGQ